MDSGLNIMNEEAITIFESQKVQYHVKKIYRKIARFSSVIDLDDCQSSAFEGILLALKMYNVYTKKPQEITTIISKDTHLEELFSHSLDNGGAMTLDTFVFWFLQKEIYKLVGGGEIEWHVWDKDGDHIKTISADEYRKQKKTLEKKGFKFTSINLVVDLNTRTDEDEEMIYEPVDLVMRGFEHHGDEHLRKMRR